MTYQLHRIDETVHTIDLCFSVPIMGLYDKHERIM